MASCTSCGKSVGFLSKKKVKNESGGVDICCESCFASLLDAAPPLWDKYSSHLLAIVTDFKGVVTTVVYSGQPEEGQATIRAVDLARRRVLWEQLLEPDCYSECYYGQHDGSIFFVNPDNDLTVVEGDSGSVCWSMRLSTKLHSAPRYHVEKGLLVVTSDRRATYYDLQSGEERGAQEVKAQDDADELLDECLPVIDYASDTIVCGEVQFELMTELYVNTEVDSGYPRMPLALSSRALEGVMPKSLVSEVELRPESRTRTVFDSEGQHAQELLSLGVEGWELCEFCCVVSEKLVCWGTSEWGDDTSIALFVFDPKSLDLERHIPLGTSDNSPDSAYPLGDCVCVSLDAMVDDDERECVFVVDIRSGEIAMIIADGGYCLAGADKAGGRL